MMYLCPALPNSLAFVIFTYLNDHPSLVAVLVEISRAGNSINYMKNNAEKNVRN